MATTLPQKTRRWAKMLNIPPSEWTAIEVKIRLRFIFYSYEKTFSHGLIFRHLVICFVRSSGIDHKIILQADNGEEFGGKSVDKLEHLSKKVFAPLNAKLLHLPKGKKEYQAFVERSPQGDDHEFYIPKIERSLELKEFYFRARKWQFKYNALVHHSTLAMAPYRKLRMEGMLSKLVALVRVTSWKSLLSSIENSTPTWIAWVSQRPSLA